MSDSDTPVKSAQTTYPVTAKHAPQTKDGGDRKLPAVALRALAEAEERRRAAGQGTSEPEHEIGGRGGKDPVRYGDWEIKGRAIDF